MLNREYDTMRDVEDTYWWYRVLRGLTVHAAGRVLAPDRPARIFDAGCGTGGTLQALRAASPQWELHGVDISPLAIAHTQQRGFEHVSVGDINALGVPDGRFDAVISLDVLSHDGVDQDLALSEFRRITVPGGALILNLPAFAALEGRHDRAVGGIRRYTAPEVRRLLLAHGYAIDVLQYWNAWMFLPVLVWRRISRFGSRAAGERSDLTYLAPPLNTLLGTIGALDARLSRTLRCPFGTSVFSVARKRGDA